MTLHFDAKNTRDRLFPVGPKDLALLRHIITPDFLPSDEAGNVYVNKEYFDDHGSFLACCAHGWVVHTINLPSNTNLWKEGK